MPESAVAARDEQEADEDELARLDAFGESLAKTRSEAIDGRQQSGIEEDWLEDEEFYQGIDDANRGEFRNAWRTKPPGRTSVKAETGTRSTVFPNITRPYCDNAAARIADMLMPTDDRTFGIEPTPVPDLIGLSKGEPPVSMKREAEAQFPDNPEQQQQFLEDSVIQAKQVMEEARTKAENAQERIDDWLVESRYQGENRRVLEDTTRIGTGVLKGPFPRKKKVTAFIDGALMLEEKIAPASQRIDPWNFFPDPACGENIHDGSYTWERDHITKRQLRELRNMPGYIAEQIDRCLEEGPQKAEAQYKPTPDEPTGNEKKGRYEIWYYNGTAEADDLAAAGVDVEDERDPHMPCMVVMVNNHVIKAAQNPLDTGDYPYDVMVWQQRSGHWAGIGVARQIRTPQRIVTAATRNLMDNAGLAAGPMLIFLQGVVSGDSTLGLGPRKVFYVAEDAAAVDDARKAVSSIKVDMLVNELTEIINLGLRFAEDVTGMPMLMQGQLGNAPDTVGGMEMLYNAASSVLRRLARLYDDLITEPHIGRYYTWLLQYGESDEEKGDYCIKARGSSALVERSLQNQEIGQLLQFAQNPMYGIDPKKAMEEFLKSRRFSPENWQYDDEEWQKVVEQMAQPKQDSSMEVAQIRAEVDQMKIQSGERTKAAEMQFEAEQKEIDRQYEFAFKQMEEAIADEDRQADLTKTLEKIKADLASSVMKIRAQRDLADVKTRMPEVADPVVEPPGKAPAGMAYQR